MLTSEFVFEGRWWGLVHVAAVIVGVGAARLVGLSACWWRRWHRDAARAMSLLREPCPRSTEWRGPPSLTAPSTCEALAMVATLPVRAQGRLTGVARTPCSTGFSQSLELEHLGVRQSPFATFIDYRVKK